MSRQGQFNLRVAEGTLAEWRAESTRQGVRLSELVRQAMELKLGVGEDAGVSVGTPPGAAAAAAHQPPSESQVSLGAGVSSADPSPVVPLPVPAARVEPAPSTPPASSPPLRGAGGRGKHLSTCTCLMCKG